MTDFVNNISKFKKWLTKLGNGLTMNPYFQTNTKRNTWKRRVKSRILYREHSFGVRMHGYAFEDGLGVTWSSRKG